MRTMDTLKEMLRNVKPLPVALAAAAILLVVGLSVARCTAVHAPEPVEEGAQQGQSAGTVGTAASSSVELTQEQSDLIASYSAKEQELIDILAANVWTSQRETLTLTFTRDSFSESAGDGQIATHTFAISAVEEETVEETGANGEKSQTTTRTAAILTDAGTYFLKLNQFVSMDGSPDMWSVVSEAFELSDSYVLDEASKELSVSDMDEGFASLIDGRTDVLKQRLSDYCAQFYPTASAMEWSGEASVDWNDHLVSTTFTLDNTAASTVNVTYNTESGEFTIG